MVKLGGSYLDGVFVVRRRVRLGRGDARSPAAGAAVAEGRVLRRRRRRSQFATAAAAALQAAVSRAAAAAAAAARPRFTAAAAAASHAGGLVPTPPAAPVRPFVIKPETEEGPPPHGQPADETSITLKMMHDELTDPSNLSQISNARKTTLTCHHHVRLITCQQNGN